MTPEEARGYLDNDSLTWDYDNDALLLDAVETISRMTWEYAVQLDYGTHKAFYVRPGIRTRYPHAAHWTDDRRELESIKTSCETYYGVPATIVRRMVSEPELSQ